LTWQELHVSKRTSAVKVLVVDDQPFIVEELCEFLESRGYRSVACGSSHQAIERFNEDPDIGLVLCDLHMPGLDGIQLVLELQRLSANTARSRRSC
jgi:CheY-like chemotaxis protein